MRGVGDNNFYFTHSFYENLTEDITIGITEYEGNEIHMFFRKANTYGTQFHPEKSSASSIALLRNIIRLRGVGTVIVIPAVDVLDHQVAQLIGGVPGSQQIVMPDP